jgi:chromosome segregation ATPase
MESHAKNESHPGGHSQGATGRDAGEGSADNGQGKSGLAVMGEIKSAVSAAAAQFGEDIHALGSELQNIESRHRSLMERLQRVAEQVDERALRQFETLKEELTGAHRQHLTLREDLELFRASLPEQLEAIGNQCARFNQQFQTAEQRLDGMEHELREAVRRIEAAEGQHEAVQQRLIPAEQKILANEQSWQRADAQLQAAEHRFKDIEEKIYNADGRIGTAERNHAAVQELMAAAEHRITTGETRQTVLEQELQAAGLRIHGTETNHTAMQQLLQAAEERIQASESRHGTTEQSLQGAQERIAAAESSDDTMQRLLQAAEQRIQAAETKHNAMEEMLQAAELRVRQTEQKFAEADREYKTLAAQMKTRTERLTAQCEEIKRVFDGQTARHGTFETSVSALAHDLGEVKGQFSELLTGPYETLKGIQGTMKSYQRILLICTAAFVLTLLMFGYVQLGKPGWQIFTAYL